MKKITFKKRIIVCFGGPPGSGKDEQGDAFVSFLRTNSPNLGVNCCDNGEGLRNSAKNPEYTDYMKNILDDSINSEGKSVPGAITMSGITEFVFRTNTGNDHFILKGVFRTPHEPDLFAELAGDYLPGVDIFFIRLNVSDEIIWQRIGGNGRDGRADDNARTTKNRIRVYREQTNPLYERIKDHPNYIFLDIDAEPSIEEVHAEIKRRITDCFVLC